MSGKEGQVELQQHLLSAYSILKDVLLGDPNNRAEAKTWLISTVAHLQNVSAEVKLTCFNPFSLRHGDSSYRSSSTHNRRSRSRDRLDDRYYEKPHHYHSSNRSRQSMHGGTQGSRCSRSDNSSQQQQQSPLESCRTAVLQLLQLLTDSQPQAVSQLLTQNSNFLHDYLSSSPATATSWFGHFSVSGIQHFKHGARALANYALTNRSEVWQHLVWSGKHDQAPVAVAAKPHYFAELDVPATIKNLARYCPGFWRSDELLRSCDGGDWLRLNPDLVVQELHHILYDTQSPEHQQLLQLIDSYIQSADWQLLCNRLLLLLSDSQLMMFISLLAQQQQQQQQQQQSALASSRQRQQQQQQCSNLHQQWCRNQAAYNARVGVHGETSAAAAAAAALPADQLPCVTELSLLLLNAAAQQCSYDDLLLCTAVTCHRGQLLNLFGQAQDDDDTAQQLLRLVTLAECVAAKQQYISAAAAAAAQADDKGKQQLLLLLSAWLLRLHLLLSCASGGVEGLQHILQQQQQWGAEWQLMTEKVQQEEKEQEQQQLQHAKHIPVQQQQQQQRQETAPQHENERENGFTENHQQQQQQSEVAELHRPLKRGLSRPKEKHKLHNNKHKTKLRQKPGRQKHEKSRKRSRSSSSSSDADDGDSQDSAPDDKNKAGRSKKQKHKHSKRHHKRRRKSSGSSSSSDWESLSDYDGGGELLDPADFAQHKSYNVDRQQLTAQSTSAAAAAAVEPRSSDLIAKQQQQQQLAGILDALGGFLVGGMLWLSPRWLLCLPTRNAEIGGPAAAAAALGRSSTTHQQSSGTVAAAAASVAHDSAVSVSSGSCCWVSGSAIDVIDAAAWYYFWLCQCNN